MIAPTFKAKASPTGIWSPSGTYQERRDVPIPLSSVQTSSAFASKPSTANHLPTTTPSLPNGFGPGSSYSSSTTKSVVSEITSNVFNKTENSESSKVVNSSGVVSSSNSVISDPVKVPIKEQKPSHPSTSSVPVPPPPPPLPIWTPKSQPSSPSSSKKNFKPVSFESPILQRKTQDSEAPKSKGDLLWESRLAASQSAPAAPGLSGLAGGPPPPPPPPPAPVPLPRAQNPTITLLQKAREGQLPRGAAYLPPEKDREPPRDRRSPPRLDSDEIVYTIKRDYSSDTDSGGFRRRMEVTPKKFEGIGPTTKDGMPIVLRSEVKEANQSKWYKKMYDTIHRNKYDDDYVTVRYKSRRAHPSGLHTAPRNTSQYAYFDPKSGYLSEPEGGARGGWISDAYDSDASACRSVGARRHSALDKGRLSDKENERSEYLPDTTKAEEELDSAMRFLANQQKFDEYSTLASAKASQEIYRNQPGRIEDYVPGKSSVVDKEAKQWWDEVMDIFDGWLDENSPLPPYNILLARAIERSQLANASTNQPHIINNKQSISSSALSKSYMARALKESGYESDSTLIFRRREGNESLLSPREQRQAYKELQAGGEPPLQGFRKPAPDRPKDDTEIEYFPLSPTLTRIRIHKNVSKNLSNNIICYPIQTTLTAHRGLSQEKQSVPSFISFEYPKVNRSTPPTPPKRLSSKANSTLKLVSSISSGKSYQRDKNVTNSNVKYLQNRLNNKIVQRSVSRESRRKEVLETKMKSSDGKRIKTTKTTVPTISVSPTGKVKSSKIANNNKRTVETVKGTSSFSSPRRTMSPIEYASPTINRYFNDTSNKIIVEGGVGRKTPITGILDRGTSLDRTFASEKRNLPLKSIRESPIKILSKSSEIITSTGSSKSSSNKFKIQKLPTGTTIKHSTVLLPSKDKTSKTLHISVAMSPRGRDFLRTSDRLLAIEKARSPTPSEISSHTYNADSPSRSLNDITKRSSSKSTVKKLGEVKNKTKLSSSAASKTKTSKALVKHKSKDDLTIAKKSHRDENLKLKSSKSSGKNSVKKTKLEDEKSKSYVSLNQILENKNNKLNSLDSKSLYAKLLNKHIDSYVQQYENNPTINYNEIIDRRDAVMTDSFFQHLFLRDVPNRFHFPDDTNYYSTTVLEKAKLFQNAGASASHLSRYTNSYLSNRRPVSESKFRSWDRNELIKISPRALSWPGRQSIRPDVSKSIVTSKYPSKIENRSKSEPPVQKLIFSQTSRPKSPVLPRFTKSFDSPKKVVYKRVTSPPAKIIFSQTSRPLSPIIIHNKRKKTPEPERHVSPSKIIFSQTSRPVTQSIIRRNIEQVSQKARSRSESPLSTSNRHVKSIEAMPSVKRKSSLSPSKEYMSSKIVSKIRVQSPSPSPLRSPSCRRIHSARISQCKAADCIQNFKSRVLRTQSAGDADTQRSRDNRREKTSLDRSTSTADLEHIRNHLDYQEYITELKHRRAKSERFKELNKFYTYLERIGQLERATSTTDLRPRKRDEEIIDFERWKRVRAQERAEEELNRLYKRMKIEQQEKDLLFLPHDAENLKWSGEKDWNLRAKEKSVEDLKDHFNKIAENESHYEYRKHYDMFLQRDSYKPLWRGNSVINLASNLSSRRQSDSSFKAERVPSKVAVEPTVANIRERLGIGSRLWSSLSMEQVSALKNQLNSIYSKEFEGKQKEPEKDIHEEYVITVPPCFEEKPSNALQVRCNSFTVGEKVNEMNSLKPHKSDSISSINHVSHEKDIKNSLNSFQNLSEKDKKRISMTLSQAVLEKIKQTKEKYSPVILAKETRGAIASAKIRGITKNGSDSPGSSITKDENTPPNNQDRVNLIDNWSVVEAEESKKNHSPLRPSSASENETGSSDTSNRTVIFRGTCEDIKKKIDFFEKAPLEDNACSVIYRPREDSPEEKEENQEEIKEKQISKIPSPPPFKVEEIRISPKRISHSSSCTSLKDIFGETQKNNFSSLSVNLKPSDVIQTSDSKIESGNPSLLSNYSSNENICRSRSLSPDPERYWRAYLSLVKAGDVGKLKQKFELFDSIEDCDIPKLRRYQSDPEIVRTFLQHNWKKINSSTNVKRHERGDVDRLTHKYELSSRGRSRNKKYRGISPIPKTPLRSDNRDMPHIDIISKLASLKPRSLTAPPVPTKEYPDECPVGEVERIRRTFEKKDTSILGQMFTSAPDFNELRDIAPYLSGTWTAHKYPRRQDNNRSLSSSDYISENKYSPVRKDRPRPKSVSPLRSKIDKSSGSILKGSKIHDVFANQEFDPSKHRPRFRYEPPREETIVPPRPVRPSWPKVLPTFTARPTVTFKDPDLAPIPPPKGYNGTRDYFSESPRRYVESDVNIHYRVPVRQEPRPLVPEDELARRQADHMRRVYQEERRRKYLQELQDMNSRRHTDNFTPSQKSPISLNRYDNFGSTGSLSRGPQLARALHNFTGQGVRELTFRRGDLILVRRRIDTNWYEGEIDGQVGLFPYNYVEMLEFDTTTITQPRVTEGRARAKFNFVAQTHLELGLKKGELVVLTRRVDDNWYEGRLAGRKGIFPVTYVEVLAEPQINRAELPPTIATGKPMASPAAHSIVGAAGAASLGAHHYTPTINNPNLSNSPSSSVPLTLPTGQGITSHHARPASATLPRASDPTPVNLNNHEPLFVDTNAEAVPYRAMYKYRPQNPDELELQEGDTVYVLEKCDDGWYVGSSQRTGRFGTFPGNYVEKI